MKIVFIQPNVGFKGHTWEALGIGYMISYLKRHYSETIDIEFYSGFYDNDDTIVDASNNADIVCFSCTSPQYGHSIKLANKINKDNLKVFGGVHPSALPNQVLNEKCVDIVVKGEGERAILQIIEDFDKRMDIDKNIYELPIIEDIDTIPFPDRFAIKNERNLMQAYEDNGESIISILSSRGCPYHCSFCCSHIVWGRKVRLRSPANILDEMQLLIENCNPDFIKFADDTFTINKKRLKAFCEQKIERGIGIPYGANAHINTIDKPILKYLAESNCRELWYGVESGSPRILKLMHKNTNIDRIKAIFKLTKDYGIKTRAYFLLGSPSETIEDIRLTEELCDVIQPDIVGFSLLSPFPCNEYFDPILMKDWDWSSFDEYSNDWVHTNALTNIQLKENQKRLVEKYQREITFRQKG